MSTAISRASTLTGAIDGANRVFTFPEAYSPGSPRVVVNGVVYRASDALFGWAETTSTTITLTTAPAPGDVVEALYAPLAGSSATITSPNQITGTVG